MNKRLLSSSIILPLLCGVISLALVFSSVPASAGRGFPSPAVEVTDVTSAPWPTQTSPATPVSGLIFKGWTKGCTSTPYISCSATVTSTQTDPYRWDFDITYTYNDNRANMGSNFTLNLTFDTGVFYTEVPIWWEMYPISGEVMPNRRIDVAYSGVSDLNPMDYPSGSWMIPSQPSPYDTFHIRFSRQTGTTETLVRTDSWHVTVATYDYHALTPTPTATLTNTPTNTSTATLTSTPTLTLTSMPTITPTGTPAKVRWYAGNIRFNTYGVKANIWAPGDPINIEPMAQNCESNWVSTEGPYWLQTGWIYCWWDSVPSQYYEATWPVNGYSGIVSVGNHNWGEIIEYKVTWDGVDSMWCASSDGLLRKCYDISTLPPVQGLALSEIYSESSPPQTELFTRFSAIYYQDSIGGWYLFDQAHWTEDSPYGVQKDQYYYYLNYGP